MTPALSVAQIAEVVCTAAEVSMTDLRSQRRSRQLVMARHVTMYLARRHTLLSSPLIGRALGGRDHATVLNGARSIELQLEMGEEAATTLVATCEMALAGTQRAAQLLQAQLLIDPDPLAAARRVLAPLEGPTRISTAEVIAMASLIQQTLAPIVERHGCGAEAELPHLNEVQAGVAAEALRQFEAFAKPYRSSLKAAAAARFPDLQAAMTALRDSLSTQQET